jgi:hypothetical protein
MLARTHLAAGLLVAWTGIIFAADPPVDFNREIRPILAKKCFACHGPDEEHREAGLRLDSLEGATKTLESGAVAIVAGDSAKSELVRRITSADDSERMPPADTRITLTADQKALLKRWVEQGASFAPHWSFIKPKQPAIPDLGSGPPSASAIDHYIRQRLEAAGLKPAPAADGDAILRRLSLDLRGLPPTLDEAAAFAADTSPDAIERLADRYLADPAYGERWARMWLDLARYADSRGYGSDPLRPNIWRYRDWVIDAFNANQPFDQFTLDQLAGDLLPGATLEQQVATAFHRNTMTNTEGGTDDEEFRVAAVKDRADTTMQVWMGITLGCAKCHNHKYDPISQREYYSFFAIFNQTADSDKGDDAPFISAPTREYNERVRLIDEQIAAVKQKLETPTPELAAEQAKWEESLLVKANWQPLTPVELSSAGGATQKTQDDGSIIVSGENANQDTFTISAKTDLAGITALRLETLPDSSLPHGSAARSPAGDFRLTRFSATAQDANSPDAAATGRFVRVELPGNAKMLSLAEVQIFDGADNIAVKGTAKQSSVDYEGEAKRAIDGNTNGHYFEAKSTTHTASEANPWWEVDLGGDRRIERISVWNRTDGGDAIGSRLAGYKVVILDAGRKVVWQQSPADFPKPSTDLAVSGVASIAFAEAFADYSPDGLSIASVIKTPADSKAGWGVGAQRDKPHWAVFGAAAPLAAKTNTLLKIKLDFQGSEPQQTLGHFRLSATNDAAILNRLKVPAEVLAVVDTPAVNRSAEQQAKLAAHYRMLSPSLKPLRDQIAALEKSKPPMPTVPVFQQLAADQERKTFIQIKGNFLTKGEEVSAGLPAAWHPLDEGVPRDRLGLARWIVHPDNPLTARVMVNRLWAQLFGVGIVETEEDFGIQGEQPSHPELLDWLAIDFMRREWDVKAMLRALVSSNTYRQSSRVTPESLAKDPRNRLLSRGPRFRLEAEMVRDQALAISGLLSHKLRGPSVYPPQPAGLWQAAFNGERTWTTSMGEDKYRRGLYTFWRRTIPYPSMTTFDATSREICAVRRIRTNTPLQAFVTLNDPVYVEASQALARRIFAEGGATPAERAAFGLRLCLIRPPSESQIQSIVALYESELAHYQTDAAAAEQIATQPLGPLLAGMDPAEAAAWTVVANVLLNMDGVLMRG